MAMGALFTLAFAFLTSGASAVAVDVTVTPNPALLGVSYIGPAPHYNCTENGAHPHKTDCEYFYECWEGAALLAVCTDMQLYSLKWKGCELAL